MLQLQPPPQLSFRLPLLFLMDNHMLLSKSSDSFVWKDKKSIKFWRSIFSSIFDSFFQANSLSNNFKYSKVDPKNDGKTCVPKRFLFIFILTRYFLPAARYSKKELSNLKRILFEIACESLHGKNYQIIAPPSWSKACQTIVLWNFYNFVPNTQRKSNIWTIN